MTLGKPGPLYLIQYSLLQTVVSDPYMDLMGSVEPDWQSGSRQTMSGPQKQEKCKNFMFVDLFGGLGTSPGA